MPSLVPPLTPRPKLKLSRLRDIGWSIWDPIDLMSSEQSWNDEECLPFADEYDSYLISAATQLRRGVTDDEVADYLVQIETVHMSLDEGNDCLERALQVVAAIHADEQLWI